MKDLFRDIKKRRERRQESVIERTNKRDDDVDGAFELMVIVEGRSTGRIRSFQKYKEE